MSIYGVDVSYFQDGMNLHTAADEGIDFAFVRTSDGTFQDPCYGSHIADAEGAGLVTAAYHFCRRPDEGSSVAAQVSASVAVMGDMRRPLWLDVETPGGFSGDLIRQFIAEFQRQGVRVIGVYSYVPYYEGQMAGGEPDSHEFGPFWVAGYPSAQGGTPLQIYARLGGDGNQQWTHPLGNQAPSIWQFTDRATVAGFQVDANAFRGTKDQLRALINGGGSPATTQEENNDMTPDQSAKLDAIYNQLAGSFKNGEYPGFDIDQLYATAASKGFRQLTMMEGVAVVVKETLLTGDQVSGPGRDKVGNRTFTGWEGLGEATLVEMINRLEKAVSEMKAALPTK